MSTQTNGQDLAVQAPAALAIRPGQEMWTDKQRAALAVLGIKDATNADLAVFMHYCQKTGLDPFSRQIYMIARREKQGDQWVTKQTIQVGIDGFRVIRDRIAARSRVTIAYGETIWYDADGGEHKVWLWDHAPAACRVDVYKNGQMFPGVVRTAAYAAKNKQGELTAQWRTQPDHMIEKCAEAFALRRAFPHDLGGIYLEEEVPGQPATAPPSSRHVTAADITGNGKPPAVRPGDPDYVDAEIVGEDAPGPERGTEPAGTGAAPEPPRGWDGGGSGNQPARFRRLTKPTLGKLKGALHALPLGNQADTFDAVSALAGRPVKTPEELSQDEAEAVLHAIDVELEAAGGDTEQAAEGVWRRVKALLPAQPDGEATDG